MENFISQKENLIEKMRTTWPWQKTPAGWVSYLFGLLEEERVSHAFLDPSLSGGGVLSLRWDGLVLRGPQFSAEQYAALLDNIVSQIQFRSSDETSSYSGITWQGDKAFPIARLQTQRGTSLTLELRTASSFPHSLQGLPHQASEVLEKMRRHPNGLMVFNHRAFSTAGGLMWRVLNTMQLESNYGTRFACVTENLDANFWQEGIIPVCVTTAVESWEQALCSLLAQDVDVFAMAGRDEQEVTSQAVLTALEDRMVLVSVSFPSAIDTLLWLHAELRVDAALVAQVLLGVVGDYKGFKKVCSHCREEYQPEESSLATLKKQGVEIAPDSKWLRGRGCEQCNQAGYKPSTERITEAIYIDRDLAQLCATRPTRETLVRALSERGFRSYLEQMMDYARQGDATLEEVIRIGMARKADL